MYCIVCLAFFGMGLQISFQNTAFQSSIASYTTVLKIAVEAKASEPPRVIKRWLRVSKGMLPVRYICSNKSPFLCQLNFMEVIRLSQIVVNMTILSFGDAIEFITMVSVHLSVFSRLVYIASPTRCHANRHSPTVWNFWYHAN